VDVASAKVTRPSVPFLVQKMKG